MMFIIRCNQPIINRCSASLSATNKKPLHCNILSAHSSSVNTSLIWWVVRWLCLTHIHVVTIQKGDWGGFSSPVFVLTGGLTDALVNCAELCDHCWPHLIFGSPTSVSVCLWSACDAVRWIRWRGEMTHTHTHRLRAVCVLPSVVVFSVSW